MIWNCECSRSFGYDPKFYVARKCNQCSWNCSHGLQFKTMIIGIIVS